MLIPLTRDTLDRIIPSVATGTQYEINGIGAVRVFAAALWSDALVSGISARPSRPSRYSRATGLDTISITLSVRRLSGVTRFGRLRSWPGFPARQ